MEIREIVLNNSAEECRRLVHREGLRLSSLPSSYCNRARTEKLFHYLIYWREERTKLNLNYSSSLLFRRILPLLFWSRADSLTSTNASFFSSVQVTWLWNLHVQEPRFGSDNRSVRKRNCTGQQCDAEQERRHDSGLEWDSHKANTIRDRCQWINYNDDAQE